MNSPRYDPDSHTTCQQCGKVFKARPVHIRNGRAKFCSKSCASKSRTGSRSPVWKGGEYHDTFGYVYVIDRMHPRANKQGYVKRAHLIAEREIGRALLQGETVHHINRIKDDDRPENLKVMTNSAHVKMHGQFLLINRLRVLTGSMRGGNNPFFNKTHSEESRQKMSKAKHGKPWTETQRMAHANRRV